MGLADRDYMQESPDQKGRLRAYDKAERRREYGDAALRRQRWVRQTAYVVIIVFVLLWLAARWLG